MAHHLKNIWRLGVKELWSLWRDPVMLVLIVYTFTLSVYTAASAMPETLHKAPIAIVDEDQSPLSTRIASAFYPPHFMPPQMMNFAQVDPAMDAGTTTFALTIPPGFQRDVLAGKKVELQLNVDATRMSQAFSGGGYVQQIVSAEINEFTQRHRAASSSPVDLEVRARFNPTLNKTWFGGVMRIINNVTMLSIILTGAALIREREHGTIEHLLVLPLKPVEIMLAKVWAMGAVVMLATTLAVHFVLRGALSMPITGSVGLFMAGCTLHLFATTSMGIYLGTVARSMPQLGLLMILVLLPLEMLSGGMTPSESMPEVVRFIMLGAPTTHFVSFAQAILYRGADLSIVWPQFAAIALIGAVFFFASLRRFRSAVSRMQT